MVERSHRDPAGEVEDHDDQRRDCVTLHEFSGAVHRTVEVRLLLNEGALAARALGIECSRVHVSVDCHLFAGHRVEREARRNFGDALRTRRDHDELDGDQDGENDQADDQVAVNDQPAEGRNQRADPTLDVTLRQNEACRGDVERKPEQRCDEECRRERRELERIADRKARQQHDARAHQIECKQCIEHRRR